MRKIIVGIAVACVLGAYAEERTVSTAQGLYEALQSLNGTGGTIMVEPGSYDISPYNMGGYWNANGVWTADRDSHHLALSNVTVTGTSMNPRDAVIYGNRTLGIIACHDANLCNLTVSNGFISVTGHSGAGVYSSNRTGSVHSNMVVTCCSIGDVKKGNGGGIYYGEWHDSTIISNSVGKNNGGGCCYGDLYNCTIISNYAASTGGGCYFGTKLYDCRVIGNMAVTGGGVATASSEGADPCWVYGGLIADNIATGNGGGAAFTDFMGGTVVSNNTAATYGGGVYDGVAANVATNTIICCNTSKYAGGAYGGTWIGCDIIGNECTLNGAAACYGVFTNCLIAGNVATKDGGGGYTSTNLDCVVSNNVAGGTGGGAYGGVSVNSRYIGNRANSIGGGGYGGVRTGCLFAGNEAPKGGGVYSGVYEDCTITNNVALSYGGGGYAGAYTNCLIACNMVTGNVVKAYGGGLYSGTASRCVISNNVMDTFDTASNSLSYGAGAEAAQIFDSVVIHNLNRSSVSNVYGGGLRSGSASNTLICGNAVYCTNGASRVGGGTATTDLRDCRVLNNYINGDNGCGVNGGSIYNCVISNNCGDYASGYCVRQVARLENCEVVGRVNVYSGPAINCRFVNFTNGVNWAVGENVLTNGHIKGSTSSSSCLYNSGLWATNCLFANNRYPSSGLFKGGTATKPVILVNCTIADNVSAKTFISASTEGANEAINCIFVGNKTSKGAANNLFYDTDANKIHLQNCLIGSGRQTAAAPTYEEGTLTTDDAGFVGGNGSGRYEPGPRSPVLGQGLVLDWMTDATDIRADAAFPRLRDGKVDIGCYQSWLDPTMLYVDPNCGDDALAGLSAASAKRTLDAACADVSNNGFTIVLLPGVHPSPSGDYSRKGSAPAYRVLFKSQQGPEQTIIDGNDERCLTGCMDAFTTIEGCTLQRFACANVNWQTFWALEFTNCVFSGDFRRATSDCRRLFQHCVFRNCRGDINLTYGADYDDSSGRYGNGTECFYGCVAFDSVFRITSSGNPHRFDGCSYFENCFIQLGAVTRLSDAIGAPHYNVLGNRQRFVDTTLVVGSATEWTAGGFFNCLLGFGDAGLPEPPNVNSCILTNANAVLAQLGDDLRPTEPTWRTYGYNRDQTDTDLALMNSLAQPNDPGLANVSGRSTYAAYSEWATSVKTSDGRKRAGVEAVAASPNAWMAFALSSPTLLNESLSEDDLCIKSFESAGAGDGASRLVLGVKDVAIGEDALPENLKKLFQVEGAATLSDGAFSTDNVSVEFDDPKGGDVAVLAKPKSASSAFFFRLKK